jgi:hypothetical protein
MTLTADGDGTYDGPSTADQFGWSFGIASSSTITAADFTGPLQAGNYTWTNGGMQSPCAGSDGTAFGWDLPIHPGPGTGMSSNDFFRLTGPAVASPGCYAFGTLHSDFYLKLFAVPDCPVSDPIVKFCAPGVGGIHSCPCGNPQVPAGAAKGCNNFAGGGTGGAVLSYGGIASLGNDTLFIHMTAGLPGVVSVLFQGTTNTVNTRSGAGLRCVGGILERLYKANLSADGSICFQQDDVRVHDASAAHGFPISAPITLFYYAAYRNSAANGQPGCPGVTFGFNATNAGAVTWYP